MKPCKITLTLSILILCISASMVSCSQSKNLVKKSYSFFTERLPGALRVDENGNPEPIKIDTIRIVYVETSVKLISWDSAWIDGRVFKIGSQIMVTSPYEVGSPVFGDMKIILNASDSNYLWQLYLDAVPNQIIKASDKKEEILIQGTYKGKKIKHKTGKAVQFRGPDAV